MKKAIEEEAELSCLKLKIPKFSRGLSSSRMFAFDIYRNIENYLSIEVQVYDENMGEETGRKEVRESYVKIKKKEVKESS